MSPNPRHLRIANLTLFDHRPHLERYLAQGYEVDPEPGGIVLAIGLSPEEIRRLSEEIAQRVIDGGYDGALLGGRPDAVCYIRDALVRAGLRCFAADTARLLDREGYITTVPVGIVEVLPSAPNA